MHTVRRITILLGLLLALSSNRAVAVVDEIVGIHTPAGGTLLVKEFEVPSGTVLAGMELKNNDDRTVFPRIALYRGPAATLDEATLLAEGRDVGATARHRVRLTFSPIVLEASQTVLVAITWPASDGVRDVGNGAGIGATRITNPGRSFLVSRTQDAFQPLYVDLAIELLYQGADKASAEGAVDPMGWVRVNSFLRGGIPNPSAGSTAVEFGIATPSVATLQIFDVAGRKVRTLVRGQLDVGVYTRAWDGLDDTGSEVAAGVYVLKLQTDNRMLTQKVVLTR
jgi:hypothetical protein